MNLLGDFLMDSFAFRDNTCFQAEKFKSFFFKTLIAGFTGFFLFFGVFALNFFIAFSCLFFSFFLRSLVFLPLDAVSLYFGASEADFGKYLLGSVLGMLPNVILSTCMGAALTDPASPAFLLSTAGFLLLSAASALWYAVRRKRRRKA
jgi:uncharacterized membrane protein YdjX (TVP38/TMEM64 family)